MLKIILSNIIISFGLVLPIQGKDKSLKIAVASNFMAPMEVITRKFQNNCKCKIEVSYGSSGRLYAKIKNGAPFEIFMSADDVMPKKLIEGGLGIEESLYTYSIGELILWSPKKNFFLNKSDILTSGKFNYLSIANPELAPYGRAAQQVLEKLKLWDQLKTKIVRGENITQAYQFVFTGNADLGFVALSQVLKEGKIEGSYWRVPNDMHSLIKQDLILLNKAKNNSVAKEFLVFIRTSEVKKIIQDFGYQVHF